MANENARAISYIMMAIGGSVWYISLFISWPLLSVLPKSMFSKKELKAANIAEKIGCISLLCACVGLIILFFID